MNREQHGTRHVPVLLTRAAELLDPVLDGPAAVYLDATLGLGGHAEYFLRTHADLRLIGLDRDTRALALTTDRLRPYADRITVVHTRSAWKVRLAGCPPVRRAGAGMVS